MKAYVPIHDGSLKKKDVTLGLRRRSEGFWILPTISRPQNLTRLIESYNAVEEAAPVVVFLWRDDLKFAENMHQKWPREWTVLIESERFTAGEAMKRAFKYAPNAEFYGFLADDVVFKTQWSQQLKESAVPCFVSYPDDGLQHEGLCTHFVCGGELVRALGYWCLPKLEHSGIDLVWMNLGFNVPGLLHYRPDVQWEHLHPLVNKAEKDEIYDFARSLLKQDDEVYQDWVRNGIKQDIETVKKLLYA